MPTLSPRINAFNAGEWSALLWNRTDLARHAAACRRLENFLPLPQGAATRRPGTRFVATTKNEAAVRLVPFEFSVEQAYVLEFGDRSLRFYRDRGRLELAAPGAAITNGDFAAGIAGWSDLSTVPGGIAWDAAGHLALSTGAAPGVARAEQAVATSGAGTPHVIAVTLKREQRRAEGAVVLGIGSTSGGADLLQKSLSEPGTHAFAFTPGAGTFHVNFTLQNAPGREAGIDAVRILSGPAFELATPYAGADLAQLKWVQSADVLYLVHPAHPPMKLSRSGPFDWSLTRIDMTDGPYLPAGKTGVVSTAATAGAAVAVTSDVAVFAAADKGRAIRLRHGDAWGWGRITAVAGAMAVTVEVAADFAGTGAAAEYRLGAWSDTTGWPSAASFFEERLYFAGTRGRPQTVWGSVVGDYENHAPSQAADGKVLDDSAVTFTIADDRVNAIHWMSAGKTLVLGTAGGAFSLSGGGQGEAVTPSSINVRRETTRGSADQQPARVGAAVLHVARSGRKLYELAYDFQSDALMSPELSVFASHLMERALVETAFQADPWSILWAAREDGLLLGLTYLTEQQVSGWHRHTLGGGGKVRALAVIPGPSQDEVWLAVERSIGGVSRHWIEVMENAFLPAHPADHAGALFADAALSYDGWNTDVTKTLTLTGAGAWTAGASKTLTATGHAPFSPGLVGRTWLIADPDPARPPARVVVSAHGSASVVSVTLASAVPAGLQGVASSAFALTAGSVSGLSHLEGQTVAITVDGAAHPDRVVSAGGVDLDRPGARVVVGLPYRSLLETMDLDAALPDATGTESRRRLHAAGIRFVDTLGAEVGFSDTTLEQVAFRGSADPMDAAPPLFTGGKRLVFPKGWDRAARVSVVQNQPLPCTVAAILPRMTANGG